MFFSAENKDSEGWWGPFKTELEAVGFAKLNDDFHEHKGCYVTTGRRATKEERECHEMPYSIDPERITFIGWETARTFLKPHTKEKL